MNSIKNILDFIEYLTYRLEINSGSSLIALNKEDIDSLGLPINELALLLKQLNKNRAIGMMHTTDMLFYNGERSLQRLGGSHYLKFLINNPILKQYKESLTQPQQKLSNQPKEAPPKSIKSVICVRPAYGKQYLLIINEDYSNPQKVDGKNKSWDLLFRLANKETVLASEIKDFRNRRTFLNSHKGNRLYSTAGFQPTKIVEIKDGQYIAIIPMQVISEKAYITRRNQLNTA